ncbi:glycoside hydrolase, family 32, N-terminal domain protein [Coriobacteriaceae bacterium BV3Ac1]|nr:glycoside hydrolase, family 32, N-terminal domain protein [Coriobacteriaceae bacterium BV3Ac1]
MAVDINWNPKHNWRLRFHLQTPTGGLTDPNGLSQLNGVYHWFHQYTPRWPAVGHGWGHWTSTDLINWTFHGEVIRPDCELDRNGAYSGSALVKDGKLWCYYTGNVLEPGDYDYDFAGRLANENLVISEDGNNFSKKVCVLDNAGYPAYCSNHVRDPKVWEQDGFLHMLLGARTMDSRGAVLLYRSSDGYTWELEGSATAYSKSGFGYMWECPNVARLGNREFLFVCPQGVPKQPFKYQNIHNCGYFSVDGKVIDLLSQDADKMDATEPYACFDENDFVETDYGFDFYCPQIFEDEQGRVLYVGWIGLPDIEFQYETPTREWMHTLTLPRELSLNEAGRVCFWPVKETEALREAPVEFSAEAAPGATGYVGSQTVCDMFDVTGAQAAYFPNGTADVLIEAIQGEGRVIIGSDLELFLHGDMLELDFQSPSGRWRTNRRLPLSALSAACVTDLRILVDTSVIEIYINGGEKTMTTRWYPIDIKNLHVTSTLQAHYAAWEMGAFGFANVG